MPRQWMQVVAVALVIEVMLLLAIAPMVTNPALSAGRGVTLLAPGTVQAGTRVVFRVQTFPHMRVQLTTELSGATTRSVHRTGRHGRTTFSYSVPLTTREGTLTVTARVIHGSHPFTARQRVEVQPFVPTVGIASIDVLTLTSGQWVPATAVQLGRVVRFVASYGVTEPAGNYFPPCVQGSVTLETGGQTKATIPVQCPAAQSGNGLPVVYAETRLTDRTLVGDLTVRFSLSYDEGLFGVAHGEASTHITVTEAPEI